MATPKQIANGLLEDRLYFEEIVSSLSAVFVNIAPDKVEAKIENSLKIIGELLGMDRVTIMIHSEDGTYVENPIVWLSGQHFDTGHRQTPSRNTIDLHQRMLKGKEFVFTSVDDIPEHWGNLKEYVVKTGIKSALIMPLKVGDRLLGGINFDFIRMEYDWPPEIVNRIRFISNVFANALARKKSEEIIRKTLKELEDVKVQLEADCVYLRDELNKAREFDEIIGNSTVLRRVFLNVERVATTDATVLILGETGTGKELFAQAVHNASPRASRPMIKINCAALPSNLIESLLFGHVKGSFTGALSNQTGRFAIAHQSTIFLDEISELPLELQPKLLRVIQEGEFEPLGSNQTVKVDVRIIAATNRDMEKEVSEGRFREDLWYRLNVFPLSIPPLRDRAEDISLLVTFFTNRFCQKHGKDIDKISQSTLRLLESYSWPGNVRELENIIERSVIISQNGRLSIDLPKSGLGNARQNMSLEEVEREHIIAILKRTRWQVAGEEGAANVLKLHPNTLRSRMKKLGISKIKMTSPM